MTCERCSGFSGLVLQFVECADFSKPLSLLGVSKLHFLCRTPRTKQQKDTPNTLAPSIPCTILPFDRPPRFFSFAKQFNIKDETIFSYVSNLDGGATWAGR